MSDETNWDRDMQDTGETTAKMHDAGEEHENAQDSANASQSTSKTADTSEKTAETPVPPRYGYYHVNQNQGHRTNSQQNRQESHRRNNRNFSQKAGTTVALATIFGLVAGIVFQGVNMFADGFLGKNEQQPIGTTEMVIGSDNGATSASADVDGSLEGNMMQGTVADVAAASVPSVVAITTVSVQEIPSFFGYGTKQYQSAGSGSGIIVGENDSELLIATNNHVISGATTLSVCFIGSDVVSAEEETQNFLYSDSYDVNVKDAVSAKIKGTDEEDDLAVIAVDKKDIPEDTMKEIKIAKLGNSDELVVGEQVVAIGNALGYGQSVTSGWVSALNRTVTMEDGSTSELIQTDAAINPGNSGGALLNMRGELVGINSAKYASSAVEGMGYAIPISKAQPILESLMNKETREKLEKSESAYLGVAPADLSTEALRMYNMPAGVFITEVFQGEAAEAAGIQKGDIIEKLDGQKVSDSADLIDKLQYYAPGEEVEIVIARADNGRYIEHALTVVLGSRPAENE